ncbi:MAG: ATP-binding protein [Bacteroidota bacterium]
MERAFKKTFRSLDAIFDFLDEGFEAFLVEESARFSIKFAVEEIFTNMVKYNPGGRDDVNVIIAREGRQLSVRLVDSEEHPFDPRLSKEVDLESPIDEREPGGLGLHLTKELMDRIEYDHHNHTGIVTLIKYLEK